jgi:hypothetical protein
LAGSIYKKILTNVVTIRKENPWSQENGTYSMRIQLNSNVGTQTSYQIPPNKMQNNITQTLTLSFEICNFFYMQTGEKLEVHMTLL